MAYICTEIFTSIKLCAHPVLQTFPLCISNNFKCSAHAWAQWLVPLTQRLSPTVQMTMANPAAKQMNNEKRCEIKELTTEVKARKKILFGGLYFRIRNKPKLTEWHYQKGCQFCWLRDPQDGWSTKKKKKVWHQSARQITYYTSVNYTSSLGSTMHTQDFRVRMRLPNQLCASFPCLASCASRMSA